jgi:aromatic-L-amino-acid decarboxylase
MVMRHFGAERLRDHLAEHMRLARMFAAWVDGDPDMERLAPVPFSVVCFRLRPRGRPGAEADLERLNQRAMDAVNASGEVFLSHTKLGDRFAIRLAVGHLKTTEHHVRRAFELVRGQL